MKIAIFTDSFHPQVNGVVVFLSESLKVLAKKHKIILFAPGSERFKIEKRKNLKIYWMPAEPFPFYEGYRMTKLDPLKIKQILEKEKPDIVHLHAPILLGINGLIIAKKLGIPTIATYHTHFPDYLPHILKGKLLKRLNWMGEYTAKKLIKIVFSEADVTTAPTQELVDELTDYGIKNVIYLPNGVNIKKLKAKESEKKKFSKKYKLGKRKIILYAGRVSPEKKLEILIKAFKKIENNKTLLLIVGAGPGLKKYKQMAKELTIKNIIFTGYVKDEMLFSAYSLADVFVSPSDSETFGLTFIEAMAFGVPVIGVNKLGAKELIINKENGYLVKAGAIDELAAKIEKLLKNKKIRDGIRKQAKKTAKYYSIERCMKKTTEIYKKNTVAKHVQKRKV